MLSVSLSDQRCLDISTVQREDDKDAQENGDEGLDEMKSEAKGKCAKIFPFKLFFML